MNIGGFNEVPRHYGYSTSSHTIGVRLTRQRGRTHPSVVEGGAH